MSGPAFDASTPVPLLDLRGQYLPLREQIRPLIDAICDSQQFILGRHVLALEAGVAAYCGTAHGIGVSSGTDALLLALMALDIGHGDEVITSPFTFFATAGTIARAGARPAYVDIDPVSFNIDPLAVRRYLATQCERRPQGLVNRRSGTRVRALMPVHLYGQCADLPALMEIAQEFDLKVIEDAAQAIGAEDRLGRRAGSVGDIGCLSFFPTKNLGAFGDAGMCVCQDGALAEHQRILRVHGGAPKYYHAFIGGNFRLDELQAAVLEVKLGYLDAWTEARQRNAAFYDAAFAAAKLEGRVITPRQVSGRHTYNQYVIRVQRRDELRAFLADRKIGSEIYYPVPLHLQKCFDYLGHKPGDFPESERAASEVLALPIFGELTRQQLEHVVASVAAFHA
ncbi:MAG: DegT/DnrJ/EryC1/StrS family aminotransferase [Steroidobacteraceae bacterium]